MSKILLADDDPSVLALLNELFTNTGYETFTAADGPSALMQFHASSPEVAVVDLRMPLMDGIELCRRIREVSQIPILMLTGYDDITDKVNAFNAGADDYVAKPASPRELLVRVQACLRRSQWPQATGATTGFADGYLAVDYARREVHVKGLARELTPIEYGLLSLLVQQAGEALSVEYLLSSVWGREYDTFDLVKWHISNLRRKLQNGSEAEGDGPIVTVRGYGYRYKSPSNYATVG
ncbi:MAG: response regulator transcription factor [Dehalococcoidia bacterium]|nr:response regulator transcription factor [Dehalococcoidia bacterium]MSQ17323.1 response regulator transcription factor [Dehalococcoidia bacterium]